MCITDMSVFMTEHNTVCVRARAHSRRQTRDNSIWHSGENIQYVPSPGGRSQHHTSAWGQ